MRLPDSIKVVQENPYRLAADIFGIGFKTADKIASNLGIDRNSEIRVEAGILYVLYELTNEGHVYYPYEPLIEAWQKILEVDKEILTKGLAKLFEEKKIVLVREDYMLYPRDYYYFWGQMKNLAKGAI